MDVTRIELGERVADAIEWENDDAPTSIVLKMWGHVIGSELWEATQPVDRDDYFTDERP